LEGIVLPPPTPQELTPNDQARGEESALDNKIDLSSREDLNKFNSLLRDDSLNSHFHIVSVFLIYFMAILVALMLSVIVEHKVCPEKWRYLSSDDMKNLYEFLFTGTFGGVFTAFTSKYVMKTGKTDK
jgi:hypothetical protein